MAANPDATEPSFPLLWDEFPSRFFDLEDYANFTLNVEGKGAYLTSLSGDDQSTSHRLHVPFPLQSAIADGDQQHHERQHGDVSSSSDRAALPLLAGDISRGASIGRGDAAVLSSQSTHMGIGYLHATLLHSMSQSKICQLG